MTLGAHAIMMWSSTQAVVAMSSGEAELYALTKGAANTIGMLSLASDFGQTLHGRISSDASAAIGIVNRTGVGKLRHVRVQYLWLQDKVRNGELEVAKVPGVVNPADLFTKHLDIATMSGHLERLGFELRSDRAETAPTLNSLEEGGSTGCVVKILHDEPQDLELDRRASDQADKWEHVGDQLVRRHRRARRELFTPLRVKGSPPARALTSARVTEATYTDGSSFRIVDAWTSRSQAHRALNLPWVGTTLFFVKS